MQIYKTIYIPEGSTGTIERCSWQASQTEASKARSQLKRDGHKVVGTQTVNIPTAKGPLLEWLNENVTA